MARTNLSVRATSGKLSRANRPIMGYVNAKPERCAGGKTRILDDERLAKLRIAVEVLEEFSDEADRNGDAGERSIFNCAAARIRPLITPPWPSRAKEPFASIRLAD